MLTLNQLKIYLQDNGPTSLLKLAKDFSESPEDIMHIAEHYISKGKICCQQLINTKTGCASGTGSGCNSCPQSCLVNNLVKLSWQ